MADQLTQWDWNLRLFIYRFFVKNSRPPATAETAVEFNVPVEDVRSAYHRLHRGHAIFLEPGTDSVRMANPLSAVPTPYRVTIDGKTLFANCAWDSVGIPAMLHRDATIEAFIDDPQAPVRYAIENGELVASPDLVVHFPVPFTSWYDDLIHT